MAIILDGKSVAGLIRAECREAAQKMKIQHGIVPGLAVILVGKNPASQVYVKNKKSDCEECGFFSRSYELSEDTEENEILSLIEELNGDNTIHGILVQLPLPRHINAGRVIMAISPQKDVDCFTDSNTGRLLRGEPYMLPCTPAGVIELLDRYDISPEGKECVVIGRSNIVGKPMAIMLLARNATVSVCHSRTKNMKEICLRADIIVAAAGVTGLLTADMVKEGAVVADVGMNRNPEGKLCGDADYDAVAKKAFAITPVPGGVGPMTRAMLMKNTLHAAENIFKG